MIGSKRVVGIIPARAWSVRIPDKNTQTVGGISLVGWAVAAARESKIIDTIVVSTNGAWIASEAFRYGADAILRRPADLSTSQATTYDTILHTVKHFPADYYVLLQPTSPARRGDLIDDCISCCWSQGYTRVCTTSDKTGKQNGMVYVFSKDLHAKMFDPEYNDTISVPHERGVDIDTWPDLVEAERLLSKRPEWFPNVLDNTRT